MTRLERAETVPYTDPKRCRIVRSGKEVQVLDACGRLELTLPGTLTDEGTKQMIELINNIYGKGVAMGMQLERFLGAEVKG
ncbi:hypothetical protein UXN85_20650 [Enterobacter hormaechei]